MNEEDNTYEVPVLNTCVLWYLKKLVQGQQIVIVKSRFKPRSLGSSTALDGEKGNTGSINKVNFRLQSAKASA